MQGDSQKALKPQQNEKYILLQKIAQGSYGSVFKARPKDSQKIVAIKIFKDIAKQGIPVSAMRQIQIMNVLKALNSQRILKLVDVHQRKGQTIMVTQWMDQTLSQFIQSGQPYNPKFILKQILLSLQLFHSNFILHRDIKPSNVMLEKTNNQQKPIIIKIVDYGMAKQDDFDNKPLTNQVGSLYYRAPELLMSSKKYNYSIDMWAIGCLFFELLTKKILFKSLDNTQISQLKQILAGIGYPNEIKTPKIHKLFCKTNLKIPKQKESPKFQESQIFLKQKLSKFKIDDELTVDLLKNLLKLQPSERFNVQKALNHDYFAQKQQNNQIE